MGNLAGLNGQRVLRAFERLGWILVRVNGSHHVLEAAGRPTVVLPIHSGKPVKEGTLRGVLKLAGLSVDVFRRYY